MRRKCWRCQQEKSLSEFTRNKNDKYGHGKECKTCSRERARERYQKHGSKMRKQMAAQRQRDYEYRLEIERRSRAKNKEKHRPSKNARQSVRNRVLANSKFEIIEKNLRRIYNSKCWKCGSTKNLSLDHIIPLSKGGNHSAGNIMTLCRSCNSSKSNKLLAEWRYKELIRGD